MQTIRTYMNSIEAEMDRQLLATNGIQAYVADENMGSFKSITTQYVKNYFNRRQTYR